MRIADETNIVNRAQSAFFIGIGGISMSSLARFYRDMGKRVSGSDKTNSEEVRALTSEGIEVFLGHDAKHVAGFDIVIYTGAVGDDNPELCEARRLGIPTLSRAEFMGGLMKNYRVRIGISGSHGKSTATAMTAHILLKAGKDPTVMCGAHIPELNGAYRAGGGGFLFEACEYRDSFLSFSPNVAVILNVDLDHTDYFKTIDDVISSFSKFARISLGTGGSVIVCADDENALLSAKTEFPITFGLSAGADYRAVKISEKNGKCSFSVTRCDEPFIKKISLSVVGRHNIYNALAAAATADLLGVPSDIIAEALSDFSGISRRFEKKGDVWGAPVYVDYAHHPREIAATVDTARKMCRGKLITVFEPHTYSRTKALWGGFVSAFSGVDVKIFTDVYAARETDMLGVSSKQLAKEAGGEYASSYEAAARRVKQLAKEGDMVLIIGAGDIFRVADMLGG